MLKAIKKRRSIRKYLPKEVEKEKLNEILRAAMFSPSAHNYRPWEFVLVKDPKIKEKLAKTTPYSKFAKNAPLILVICANEKAASRWIEDCSILAENIYLEATNQGLGTCFIQIRKTKTPEGKNGENQVRKILSIPKNIRVLCLMPIGYPAEKKEEHKNSEFEKEKIHREVY